MRISYWRSDVCSSDLYALHVKQRIAERRRDIAHLNGDGIQHAKPDLVEAEKLHDRDEDRHGQQNDSDLIEHCAEKDKHEQHNGASEVAAYRQGLKSEERRVGKECVRKGRYRGD